MEKMKDSGIRLIGVIPSDWNLKKIKYVCFENSNSLPENTSPDFEFDYIDIGSVKFGKGITDYQRMQFSKAPSRARRIVKKGDVIISTVRTYLKSVASIDEVKTPIIVSTGFSVLTPKENIDKNYLKFAVMCDSFTSEVEAFSTGITYPAINSSSLINLKIPLPPIEIQKRIADFLDSKCAKIDSLKNDIEKQIETLEQYKKSVITEAVTKGINHDAKMKDSGIEWIGEIPEHWEIHPIYYYFEERKLKNSLCKEENLLSLSYGNVIRKDINALGGLLPESFNTYNIIEKDDIVIRPTDLQNDKRSLRTGLCKEHGIITSAYITLKPKKNVNSQYFHYLLHSYDIEKVFYNMGNGVRQGLNYSEFKKLLVISPTLNEQKNIVEYLDSKCLSIDNIINSKKQQLEKLEEYKKSLIFEYVTGKKEC